MITPAQLSLFSLNAQKQLLDKYGILLSTNEKFQLKLRTYQLKRTFFHVYENKLNKEVTKVIPSNTFLLF